MYKKHFLDAIKLGIEHQISTFSSLNKLKPWRYDVYNIHDDSHSINDFLSKCSAGR